MTDLDRIAPIHTPARVMLDSVLFCFTSFDLGRVWLELSCIYSCHLSAVTKLLTVFSSHVTLCLQSNVLVACPSNNWSFSLFEICKLPIEDAADWPWMAVSACVYCLQRFESHGNWEDSGKGMQAFTFISEKSRCRKILIKKKLHELVDCLRTMMGALPSAVLHRVSVKMELKLEWETGDRQPYCLQIESWNRTVSWCSRWAIMHPEFRMADSGFICCGFICCCHCWSPAKFL